MKHAAAGKLLSDKTSAKLVEVSLPEDSMGGRAGRQDPGRSWQGHHTLA